MLIDEKKVNLAEKDIEQYLFGNPGRVKFDGGVVVQWIKRQYKVPSGVVDLVGLTDMFDIAVVEIKNTGIDAAALTQVARYAADVEVIYDCTTMDILYPRPPGPGNGSTVHKIVIGRSIDARTLTEANALGIHVLTFAITLSLSTTQMWFSDEHDQQRWEDHKALGQDNDWIEVARQYLAWTKGDEAEEVSSQQDAIPTEQPDEISEFIDDLLGREE